MGVGGGAKRRLVKRGKRRVRTQKRWGNDGKQIGKRDEVQRGRR